MSILLPLTLIGVGVLLVELFGAATLALPIAAAVAAGFGASALGAPSLACFAIGMGIFMAVIAVGRFAALTFGGPYAKATIVALFAIPAGVAGYCAAFALTSLAGAASIGIALVAAVACAAIAARRLVRPVL